MFFLLPSGVKIGTSYNTVQFFELWSAFLACVGCVCIWFYLQGTSSSRGYAKTVFRVLRVSIYGLLWTPCVLRVLGLWRVNGLNRIAQRGLHTGITTITCKSNQESNWQPDEISAVFSPVYHAEHRGLRASTIQSPRDAKMELFVTTAICADGNVMDPPVVELAKSLELLWWRSFCHWTVGTEAVRNLLRFDSQWRYGIGIKKCRDIFCKVVVHEILVCPMFVLVCSCHSCPTKGALP